MEKRPLRFLIILLFVGVIVVWAASWPLVSYLLPGWNERSAFGDMFGAVNALFSALAFAALIVAIYLQTQELSLQRQELKETRDELRRTAEAQEKSERALSEQVNALNRQATAVYQYIQNWQESNRPLITARVTTHSGGNVGATLNLLVENTGNRPAKNVRLSVDEEALDSALIEPNKESRRHLKRIFSERGVIPVLANGRIITNGFGFIGRGESEDATWKIHARFDVTLSYEDLEGKQYSHNIPLLIADDTGFAGSYWNSQEKPDPVASSLKELVRIHERTEEQIAELVKLASGNMPEEVRAETVVEIDEQGNVYKPGEAPLLSKKKPTILRDPEGEYGGISIDIFSLLQILCAALGGAKIIIELAKLWVEDRKGRKVILKKGDVEIEIQGGVTVYEINEKIELFKELSKDTQTDEVKIIVP